MTTPWFFLSYSVDENDTDEERCVAEFHDELVKEVSRQAGLKGLAAGKIGFLDRADIELGKEWDRDIAEALQTCRILVCLYSPNYFNSDYCRREREIFLSRYEGYQNDADPKRRPSRILPVLWGMPHTLRGRLGTVLDRIQNNHRDLGEEYAREGLFSLKRDKKTTECEVFIRRFARRLIAEAQEGYLPPLPELPTLKRTEGDPQTPAENLEGADAGRDTPSEAAAAGRASEAAVVTDEATRPGAPRALSAKPHSRNNLLFNWSGEVEAGGGFLIERCRGKDCTEFSTVRQVGEDEKFFLDAGLAHKTCYAYRVRAFDRGGKSDPSNIVHGRTRSRWWPWPVVARVVAALVVAAIIAMFLFRGGGDCNDLDADGPKPRTNEFSDTVVRAQGQPPSEWRMKGEWDPAAKWSPRWPSETAEDGWLVVRGREPGFQKDYFENFRLSVSIEFEQGMSAGMILRGQGDGRSDSEGYCFVIEKQGEGFYLTYYWGRPQARPAAAESKRIGMTEFAGNAGDSVDVVVIAEGDSFKFEFKPNTSGDPIPVPVNANEFDLKPGQCHPRLGRVGFFAGDDEDGDAASRFRMDTVKITPLASQPPPNNDGSPQPGM